MDTQINYSDDMMLYRQQCLLSLKEFGFGKDIYEFCTDWVLNHDTTAGIKEAFREYETQRPDQTIKVSNEFAIVFWINNSSKKSCNKFCVLCC